MARVAFEHVDKVFPDGTPAVVDCNLAVADGELVVLVGPSGSGKSTVLRMVAGLEEITRGTLRIADRVANDLSPRERNVAMVFQDYALYPHMSVRENLEFPLRMRGLARAEMQRRVAWAAEVLDIAGVLDRRPRQLSGGQQQRVAMGRALVREPTVFLLDEPLSNLDAKLRVEVRAEIAELQRRMATTMLYVTHDQTEAMTLGDRVAVLRAGRIRQVATPRELYERPADAFVAGFIGNPPMNLLPARMVRDGGGVRLRLLGETIALDGLVAAGRPLPDAEDVVAGVRPEGLELAAESPEAGGGAPGHALLRGRVEHLEWLGHETLAHVVLGGDAGAAGAPRAIARLPGMQALERGDAIALAIAPGSLHVFPREEDAGGARG